MSRTRLVVKPLVTRQDTCFYRALPSGTWTNIGTHPYSFTGGSRRIIDEPRKTWVTSERSSNRRLMYKPVENQKWEVTTSPGSPQLIYANWNYSGEARLTFPWQCRAIGYNPADLDWGIHIANHTRDRVRLSPFDFHYDRWLKAKPSMSTRAGLSVFLYELSDIVRMFKLLPPRHLGLKDWRETLRYGNNLHLNYNFGWKPFFRDVTATFNAISTFEKRLTNFLVHQGILMSGTVCDSPTYFDLSGNFLSTGFWTGKWTIKGTGLRCSSFMYDYIVPAYSESEMRWRAWADSLGLNINPSTIWAVVPWSFVVDWFYNVDNLLNVTDDWLQPWITWLDACCSYRSEVLVEWWLENTYGQRLSGFRVSFEEYTRLKGFPEFSGATQDLNSDKIRLGTSLLAGRLL